MRFHFYRSLFFLLILIISGNSYAQEEDYTWWNNKHGHDGITNWMYYMKYAPAYFGPNALPVPEIRNALSDTMIALESDLDLHFSQGDNTQNLFIKLSIPFLKGRVSLEMFGVPIEHFKMDTLTRDERVARNYEGEGYALGDLYISTLIQITRNYRNWPDLLLGITLRTASGGNLGNARFTDAPGYYFDLSAGKSYRLGDAYQIRPYAMLGFYVYHTNREDWRQNDAFLYGLGLSAYSQRWTFSASWGGYKGYFNDGDAPMVARANVLYKFRKLQLKLAFQQGLHDFKYSSVRVGTVFLF
jgi:hypothetical protein